MACSARITLDRLFDRLASGKRRSALLVLAVPAVVGGLVVTVHSGDTLSGIAARECGGHANDWTGIYAANRAVIGSNPNLIEPGQQLKIKCDDPPQLLGLGSTSSQPAGSARVQAPSGPASVSTAGMGSFQACVISRESGGNSQVMNSSGHYGLYQFAAGTWAAYGGNPADFGNASAAEQTQVFDNAIAAGGQSNWSPYDGC